MKLITHSRIHLLAEYNGLVNGAGTIDFHGSSEEMNKILVMIKQAMNNRISGS